jgi:hypothetical protein
MLAQLIRSTLRLQGGKPLPQGGRGRGKRWVSGIVGISEEEKALL